MRDGKKFLKQSETIFFFLIKKIVKRKTKQIKKVFKKIRMMI